MRLVDITVDQEAIGEDRVEDLAGDQEEDSVGDQEGKHLQTRGI
jgi:hypothetical protein